MSLVPSDLAQAGFDGLCRAASVAHMLRQPDTRDPSKDRNC